MAKGDHKRVENEINRQSKIGDARNTQTYNTIAGSNQGFQNSYNQGASANLGDYNNMMGMYQDIYNNPFGPGGGSGGGGGIGGGGLMDMYSNLAANGGGYAWDPEWRGAVGRAIGGFQNFADTGGFSEQDKQDMRARAIAPTRAVFQNAMNEARRGQALSGGSPNFNSALSRMARQNAYAIGDMNTNANAALAEMVQQGKLAGLGGMSSTGLGAQDRSNAIDSLNAQMKLAGLQGMQSVQSSRASAGAASDAAGAEARLAALGGMRQLYGTNPALLATTGDQLLNSDRNLLGAGELSNNFGGQTINARLGNAQVPGNFQSVMGNIGSVMNAAGAFVNPLGSLLGGGSGNYSTKPYYGGSPVYGASTAPWERTM